MRTMQDEYISPLLGRPYTKEEKEEYYQKCLALVKEKGWHIDSVPDRLIDLEMAKIAISSDSSVLRILPEQFKTKEICLIAVRKSGFSFKDIPEKILDEDIYFETIKYGTCKPEAIPKQYMTPKLCVFSFFIPEQEHNPKLFSFSWFIAARIQNIFPKEMLEMAPCLTKLLELKKPFETIVPICEDMLLKGKTVEELLTHSHPWFRAQGLKLGALSEQIHHEQIHQTVLRG